MSNEIRHQARNWLHHLLLAVVVAEADSVAKNFAVAGPLEVVSVSGNQRWTEWNEWRAYLKAMLGPLKPAELSLHIAGQPAITMDEGALERVALSWEMSCARRSSDEEPVMLACKASLVREQARWVAERLEWRVSEAS